MTKKLLKVLKTIVNATLVTKKAGLNLMIRHYLSISVLTLTFLSLTSSLKSLDLPLSLPYASMSYKKKNTGDTVHFLTLSLMIKSYPKESPFQDLVLRTVQLK